MHLENTVGRGKYVCLKEMLLIIYRKLYSLTPSVPTKPIVMANVSLRAIIKTNNVCILPVWSTVIHSLKMFLRSQPCAILLTNLLNFCN